jgi:diguanylate cyclase (GGDEF)-like protein
VAGGRWAVLRRGEGQAALLFVLAGLIGLVNVALPGPTAYDRPVVQAINVATVIIGLVTFLLPWSRLPHAATLVLVPVALTLIALSSRFGGTPPTIYGVYFVVVFAWVGMWHRPGTAARLAAPTVVLYLLPFVGVGGQADAIRSVGVVVPVCAILGEVMAATVDKMRVAHEAQERAASALAAAMVTDELTGLGNRRKGDQLLGSIAPGDALLILDLDRFKSVNDTLGHAEGDSVLARLGQYLRGALGADGEVARYGGDEVIIVHRAGGPPAVALAERLLHGWRLLNPGITFSVGVSLHLAGAPPTETFGKADAALYEAKRAGRNRFHEHGGSPFGSARPLHLVPKSG